MLPSPLCSLTKTRQEFSGAKDTHGPSGYVKGRCFFLNKFISKCTPEGETKEEGYLPKTGPFCEALEAAGLDEGQKRVDLVSALLKM